MIRCHKKNKEFSKQLLIQESILIWIVTISFLVLAFIRIIKGYIGSLPWLTSLSALPWSAYGVSQCFYYNKSKSENTKNGIVYETALLDQKQQNECINNDTIDLNYGL